jgi:hypothetical protein
MEIEEDDQSSSDEEHNMVEEGHHHHHHHGATEEEESAEEDDEDEDEDEDDNVDPEVVNEEENEGDLAGNDLEEDERDDNDDEGNDHIGDDIEDVEEGVDPSGRIILRLLFVLFSLRFFLESIPDVGQHYHSADIYGEDRSSDNDPGADEDDLNQAVYLTPHRAMRRFFGGGGGSRGHRHHRQNRFSMNEFDPLVYALPPSMAMMGGGSDGGDDNSGPNVIGLFDGSELRLRIDSAGAMGAVGAMRSLFGGDAGGASISFRQSLDGDGNPLPLPFDFGTMELPSIPFSADDLANGSLNITFGRPPSSNQVGTSSGLPSSAGGPSSHPLLAMIDNRRNRSSLPSFPSFIANTLSASSSSSRNEPYYSLESQSRSQRAVSNTRRKAIGPLVSDRRWGTDIGEIESSSARLPSLIKAVQLCIELSLSSSSPKPFESLFGLTNDINTVPKSIRESTGITPDNIFGINFLNMLNPSHPSVDVSRMEEEESKEEGSLQETKEDIPDFSSFLRSAGGLNSVSAALNSSTSLREPGQRVPSSSSSSSTAENTRSSSSSK